MSKCEKGFSLIELVMVMVIIGLLGAVAIPSFVDKDISARITAKNDKSAAIKNAMNIALADSKTFPSVTQLASYVQGETVSAIDQGIVVNVIGEKHIVPTYSDSNCTVSTKTVNDTVKCVGQIP